MSASELIFLAITYEDIVVMLVLRKISMIEDFKFDSVSL